MDDSEDLKKSPKSDAAKRAARKYYLKNKEKVIARAKKTPIEKQREYKRRWARKNKDKVRYAGAARKKRQRQAAPPWLTTDQWNEMNDIYLEARETTKKTNVKHVVDHIVPIKHSHVCGLHVPWNLRVITREENSKKSNKFAPG